MLHYGFFNAEEIDVEEYDRVYNAEQFAEYFHLFVGNGVFPDPVTQMQVIANSTPDMNVSVREGYGWINGYWAKNDSPYSLAVQTAHGSLNRIDAVVLRWVNETRVMELAIKTGTPAAEPIAPEPQRDADIYELILARITVNAGTTSISQALITDTRPDNSVCGWVTGLIDQIDTTELFAQYDDAFQTFFNDLKEQLSGNVAVNLQLQIDRLEEEVASKATQEDVNVAKETVLDVTTGKLGRVRSYPAPFFRASNTKLSEIFKKIAYNYKFIGLIDNKLVFMYNSDDHSYTYLYIINVNTGDAKTLLLRSGQNTNSGYYINRAYRMGFDNPYIYCWSSRGTSNMIFNVSTNEGTDLNMNLDTGGQYIFYTGKYFGGLKMGSPVTINYKNLSTNQTGGTTINVNSVLDSGTVLVKDEDTIIFIYRPSNSPSIGCVLSVAEYNITTKSITTKMIGSPQFETNNSVAFYYTYIKSRDYMWIVYTYIQDGTSKPISICKINANGISDVVNITTEITPTGTYLQYFGTLNNRLIVAINNAYSVLEIDKDTLDYSFVQLKDKQTETNDDINAIQFNPTAAYNSTVFDDQKTCGLEYFYPENRIYSPINAATNIVLDFDTYETYHFYTDLSYLKTGSAILGAYNAAKLLFQEYIGSDTGDILWLGGIGSYTTKEIDYINLINTYEET